jgi:hypothetical protein
MKQIYLDTLARIESQVTEIKYIDQDFGQIDNIKEGGRAPVGLPCALLDFDDARFSDLGNKAQLADPATMKIRLVFPMWNPGNSLVKENVRNYAVWMYDVEIAVNQALHGWRGSVFGPLMRTRRETEKRSDYKVITIYYEFSYKDKSCSPDHLRAPSTIQPGISVSFIPFG